LLTKARVQSRAALLRKTILTAAEAGCPICHDPLETANHIFFDCSFARRFWTVVGFSFPLDADVRLLHEYAAPAAVPADSAVTFVRTICLMYYQGAKAIIYSTCTGAHMQKAP
jgi:hypothetical protein